MLHFLRHANTACVNRCTQQSNAAKCNNNVQVTKQPMSSAPHRSIAKQCAKTCLPRKNDGPELKGVLASMLLHGFRSGYTCSARIDRSLSSGFAFRSTLAFSKHPSVPQSFIFWARHQRTIGMRICQGRDSSVGRASD